MLVECRVDVLHDDCEHRACTFIPEMLEMCSP